MPHYGHTKMMSHRHPYAGDDDFLNIEDLPEALGKDDVDKVFQQSSAAAAKQTDMMKYVSPLLSGGIQFLLIYGACRASNVEKKKAVQVGAFMGCVTVVGYLFSDWLWDKLQDLKGKSVS